MSFLLANAGILILFVVEIIILVLGFVLVPFLQKKGVSPKIIGEASGVLNFLEKLTGHMNLGVAQGRTNLILNVAETAVNYVEQIMRLGDNKAKKDKAVETTTSILSKFGVNVTPEDQSLLDIGIESAVNKLPQTNPLTISSTPINVSTTPNTDANTVVQQIIQQIKNTPVNTLKDEAQG